jgi:hypothetical protein
MTAVDPIAGDWLYSIAQAPYEITAIVQKWCAILWSRQPATRRNEGRMSRTGSPARSTYRGGLMSKRKINSKVYSPTMTMLDMRTHWNWYS